MSLLTPEQLGLVWKVADVLVPAQDPMPGLRTLDPHGDWVDRVLNALPRLMVDVPRVLATLGGEHLPEAIRVLHASSPVDFDILATLVCGAYYLTPQVRHLIGYPGQVRSPARFDEAAGELDGELLNRLLAQPTIYLAAPERHSNT